MEGFPIWKKELPKRPFLIADFLAPLRYTKGETAERPITDNQILEPPQESKIDRPKSIDEVLFDGGNLF